MANPYHDANGKFCSKGGMRAAYEQLATTGDHEGYFKLRTEYEALTKEDNLFTTGQPTVSKELIADGPKPALKGELLVPADLKRPWLGSDVSDHFVYHASAAGITPNKEDLATLGEEYKVSFSSGRDCYTENAGQDGKVLPVPNFNVIAGSIIAQLSFKDKANPTLRRSLANVHYQAWRAGVDNEADSGGEAVLAGITVGMKRSWDHAKVSDKFIKATVLAGIQPTDADITVLQEEYDASYKGGFENATDVELGSEAILSPNFNEIAVSIIPQLSFKDKMTPDIRRALAEIHDQAWQNGYGNGA